MPYGTIKIDTITFTDAGVDKSIAVSGLVQNPTFTGNVTVTGTVSGATVRATTVSGVTVSGTTANFASGVYTTQISGAIVKVPAGTAGAPTVQVGTGVSIAPGLYSPATDQLGISTGGTFRLVIDSTGRVGIGTSSPGSPLQVVGEISSGAAGTNGSIVLRRTSDGAVINSIVYDHATEEMRLNNAAASGKIAFLIYSAERARIDSSGRLLVGTSTARDIYYNATATARLQVEGTDGNSSSISLVRNSADAGSGALILGKTRGNSVGATTAVQSGDNVGEISFQGSDGTEFVSAAVISGEIDGTPGANDMPGRLVFRTTADGVSSPTERMRIDSSGRVGIGTSSPGSLLDVRFGTNPITDNGNGVDALKVWTGSALAANSGGAISLGGTSTSAPSQTAFGQIAGRKENATSANYAGYLQFATNNSIGTMSEWMRIDSSGRVGIGTSSPQTTLDIGTGGMARVASASGNNQIQVSTGSNGLGMWAGGSTRFYTTGGMTFSVNSTIGTDIPTGYTDAVAIDSTGVLKFNSGFGSVGNAYGCRAWANINAGATPVIRASGNVSSVTDFGAGVGAFTMSFTSAMPDANFAAVVSAGGGNVEAGDAVVGWAGEFATGYVRIGIKDSTSNANVDVDNCMVAVFR